MDWDRFQTYTHRIRSIIWSDRVSVAGLEGRISPSILEDLFGYFPGPGAIAPLLNSVTWKASDDTSVKLLPSFLTGSLRNLSLEFRTQCRPAVVSTVLHVLSYRSPKLSKLELKTNMSGAKFQVGLASCIGRLKSLQEIILPRFSGTPGIVTALASSKELTSIRQPQLSPLRAGDRISGLEWSFPASTFQSLTVIELDTYLDHAAQLFHAGPPQRLGSFFLNTVGPFSNDKLRAFTVHLADSVPTLKRLALNLRFIGNRSEDRMEFQALEPLLRCHSLETFEVGHTRSIQLTDSNVIAMGNAWPQLLDLSITGGGTTDLPRTHITILNTVAKHFQKLQVLEMAVSIDDAEEIVPGPTQFKNLQELEFDDSAIGETDIAILAMFLGFLLPPGVDISSGRAHWHHAPTEPAEYAMEETYSERWDKVATGVKAFHGMKEHVR